MSMGVRAGWLMAMVLAGGAHDRPVFAVDAGQPEHRNHAVPEQRDVTSSGSAIMQTGCGPENSPEVEGARTTSDGPSLVAPACKVEKPQRKKVIRYLEPSPSRLMAAGEAAIKACRDCRDSPREWCVCTDADLVGNHLVLARSHRHIGFLFKNLAGLADMYFFDLQEPDLAAARYEQLIKDVPKARALPQAYLALGEIRFAMGDWRGAEMFYDKAAASDDVGSAACATYRKAWTLLRRGYPYLARKAFKACQKRTQGAAGLVEIHDACLADERTVSQPGR